MPKKGPKPKKSSKSRVGEPPKTYEHTEEKLLLRPDVGLQPQSAPPVARDWRAALKDFAAGVKELYGPRLHSVVLYGSRARGDAEADSDVDVLVVLTDLADSWEEAKRMSPLATRMLLDHGALITVLAADVRQFAESDKSLFVNIRRDGVRIA